MSKYFKYALGEIILVVIGILIALQINNWNESRKEDQKIQSILLKIKDDLIADLDVVNNNMYSLKQKDSLALLIYNKEMDEDTFINMGGANLPFISIVLDMNTSGYEQLKANIDKVPREYSELMSALNDIYISTKSNLDIYNQIMDETVNESLKSLAKTKSWFADWGRGIPSEDAIEYFMNDSLSLNQMTFYLQSLESTAFEGHRLKVRSINAIKLIDSITQSKSDLPPNVRTYLADTDIRNGLLGTYRLKENKDKTKTMNDTTLYVSNKKESLFINSDTNPETILYWCYNLTFVSQPGFVSFKKQENGEIELQIQKRSGNLSYVKE